MRVRVRVMRGGWRGIYDYYIMVMLLRREACEQGNFVDDLKGLVGGLSAPEVDL